MPLLRLTLIVLPCTLLLGAVVGAFFPSLRPLLIAEDSLVETTTALFFFSAGTVALWHAVRHPHGRKLQILVAGVGFLGFFDEISFGERLFALDMPKVLGVKIDAAHDLVELVVVAIGRWFHANPVACLGFLAAVLGAGVWVVWQTRTAWSAWLGSLRSSEAAHLAGLFVAIGLFVVLLDLDLFRSPVLMALEEMSELNAAFVLLTISLSLRRVLGSMRSRPSFDQTTPMYG